MGVCVGICGKLNNQLLFIVCSDHALEHGS